MFKYEDGLEVKFVRFGVAVSGEMKRATRGWQVVDELGCFHTPEDCKYLRPAKGFWPMPGDVLVWPDGGARKVLAWVDEVYMVSVQDGVDFASTMPFTNDELVEKKVRILGHEEVPIKELTKEEAFTLLAEKLGVDKKTIRIKD